MDVYSPDLSAAFYEAFSPQQARYLTKKLEFHYTPEHSSWLNMAEVEISVLTEQYLDRRLASQAIVARTVKAPCPKNKRILPLRATVADF